MSGDGGATPSRANTGAKAAPKDLFDSRSTVEVKRGLANLIRAADEGHTDFVFVPELLAVLGWTRGGDYEAASDAFQFSADHPELRAGYICGQTGDEVRDLLRDRDAGEARCPHDGFSPGFHDKVVRQAAAE